MTRDDLIFMSNDQVKEAFSNKRVHAILNDGQEVDFTVAKLLVASYTNDEAYSAVGFISNLGKSYLFPGIKEITVINI